MTTMELIIQSHKYQKGVMTYMFNWSLKPLYFQDKIWQGVGPTGARPAFLLPGLIWSNYVCGLRIGPTYSWIRRI